MFKTRKTLMTAVTVLACSSSTASLIAEKAPHVGGAGKGGSKDLVKMVKNGDGKAQRKTGEGGTLIATLRDGKLVPADGKGGTTVTIADVYPSISVIHVVDSVLLFN